MLNNILVFADFFLPVYNFHIFMVPKLHDPLTLKNWSITLTINHHSILTSLLLRHPLTSQDVSGYFSSIRLVYIV